MKSKNLTLAVFIIALVGIGLWLFIHAPTVVSEKTVKIPIVVQTSTHVSQVEPPRLPPAIPNSDKTNPMESSNAPAATVPLADGALVQPKSVVFDGNMTKVEFDIFLALNTPVKLAWYDGSIHTITATLSPDGQRMELKESATHTLPTGETFELPAGGSGWLINGAVGETSTEMGNIKDNLNTNIHVTVKLP